MTETNKNYIFKKGGYLPLKAMCISQCDSGALIRDTLELIFNMYKAVLL